MDEEGKKNTLLKMIEMILFTLPPKQREWDYLLVNPKNYKTLFKRNFKLAILDAGIEIFHKQLDYPKGFIQNYIYLAKYLTRKFQDKIWVVCPDYPSDMTKVREDAIEKTLENIRNIALKIENVKWIVVIQGKLGDKNSFEYCAREIKRMGDFERVGIGTICKSKNVEFIKWCCKTARKYFQKSWIHAFGMTLTAVKYCKYWIDSYDSIAYTFPRGAGSHSCKNNKERIEYFDKFIKRHLELSKTTTKLTEFLGKGSDGKVILSEKEEI